MESNYQACAKITMKHSKPSILGMKIVEIQVHVSSCLVI